MTDWHQIEEIVKNSEMTLGLHTNNMPYLVDNKEVLTLKANFGTFKKIILPYKKYLKNIFTIIVVTLFISMENRLN